MGSLARQRRQSREISSREPKTPVPAPKSPSPEKLMETKTLSDVRILPDERPGVFVMTIHAGAEHADYRMTQKGLKLLAIEVIEALAPPGANSG